MNGTSGFQEVLSSPSRSSHRILREQRHRFKQMPGTFLMLTMSSLPPQESAQSEIMFMS